MFTAIKNASEKFDMKFKFVTNSIVWSSNESTEIDHNSSFINLFLAVLYFMFVKTMNNFCSTKNEGIEKLHEIISEEEVESDRNRLKRIWMVIVNLPVGLIKFPFSYNEDVNGDTYQLILSGGR